jgi:N-acetylneuraminic acid mutarotase
LVAGTPVLIADSIYLVGGERVDGQPSRIVEHLLLR